MNILQLFLCGISLFQFGLSFSLHKPSIQCISRECRGVLCMKNQINSISLSVSDLTKSLEFYKSAFGMTVIQSSDKSAVLGPDAESTGMKLELVERKGFKKGDAFIGIGIKRPDAIVCFSKATVFGGSIALQFDEYEYGASMVPDEDEMKNTKVSYGKVLDPDGYTVEIIEGENPSQIYKVIIRVEDLNDSIQFYSEKLGMSLLRKRSNIRSKPRNASIIAFVGFEPEKKGPLIELFYKYATEKLNIGEALTKISIYGDNASLQETWGKIGQPTTIELPEGSFQVKDNTGYLLNLSTAS